MLRKLSRSHLIVYFYFYKKSKQSFPWHSFSSWPVYLRSINSELSPGLANCALHTVPVFRVHWWLPGTGDMPTSAFLVPVPDSGSVPWSKPGPGASYSLLQCYLTWKFSMFTRRWWGGVFLVSVSELLGQAETLCAFPCVDCSWT